MNYFIQTSASLSMPIQQSILIIIIDITPNALNPKFEFIIGISFNCKNDLKDTQNPIAFIAAEIVFANANKIPIDAPNSGPIEREIMK